MTLLTIVQAVALRSLKTLPANLPTATGSGDVGVQQMIGYVNEEGQELAHEYTFQALRREASFSTPGVQGAIGVFGTITPGAAYGGAGPGSPFSFVYNNVPLTGGSGAGALATITITAGKVTAVVLTLTGLGAGAGYIPGDVLSAAAANLGGTGAGFSVTVSTVSASGQQAQGSILTLAGADFAFMINETFWDRTTRRPIFGPLDNAEWQQLKAQQILGPWYQYTIINNQILFLPVPPVGDQCFFEWQSANWATDTLGTTGKTAMNVDSDVAVISERVITLGAIVRFKNANGIPLSGDGDKYEGAKKDLQTRDASKGKLNLTGKVSNLRPGILIPAGNWAPGT